jgi:SpoIID/LytB domain protein
MLELVGHGWGHGIGMGAYGALGYALAGWKYTDILSHYYGGTVLRTVPSTTQMTVHLQELDGASSITVSASPATQLLVNGKPQAATTVILRRGVADQTVTDSKGGDISVAGSWSTGPTRSFAGEIVLKASPPQVWNKLPLDQYVEGVVPRESPPSWPKAELQSQAVAARSFALADSAAATPVCDTDYCQVYGGDPAQYPGDLSDLTNQAVTSTAGQVLECGSDSACGVPSQIALAMYSSSTGGWTAGGIFPAVVDAGDATASNPNHYWSATIPASAVQAAFPSVGKLESVLVTARNGLGDLGGRVQQMVVSGSSGTETITGEQFQWALGLKSDWFALTNAGVAPGSDAGYWVVDDAGGVHAFGNAPPLGSLVGTAQPAQTVGMAPTPDARGYWLVASDGGVAGFGDAGYHGSTRGIPLNAPVLGLSATPTGRGYWLIAHDGGVFTFGDAHFYGSTGDIRLNRPVDGLARTHDGGGYWLVASDGGVFTFGDAKFYGSTGSVLLNRAVVGMVPTGDGRGYWLIGADGGVFTFGDAPFVGSLPGRGITDTIVSVSPTPDGRGYVMVSASGRVYVFGDATYLGDPSSSAAGWTGEAVGVYVAG